MGLFKDQDVRQVMDEFFGKEPHQLHRKDDPDTSIDAAHTVNYKGDEHTVYQHIIKSANGLTVKDLVPLMGKGISSFSSRISSLIEKGLCQDSGRRKDGCRVIIGVSHE